MPPPSRAFPAAWLTKPLAVTKENNLYSAQNQQPEKIHPSNRLTAMLGWNRAGIPSPDFSQTSNQW
jgi:hypothetical protein